MSSNGQVGILNVGAGDVRLVFDKDDPAEVIRASRIVKDMIRRGYALLVQREDGRYQRAIDFDEETAEYIVADLDPAVVADDEDPPAPKKRGRPRKTRVAATGAKATAVGKTAGG